MISKILLFAWILMLGGCGGAGSVEKDAPPVTSASILYEGAVGMCGKWMLYEDGLLCVLGSEDMEEVYGKKIDDTEDVWWHEYREKIKEVFIQEQITSIVTYAFKKCTNLQSVKIPTTIRKIGMSAFEKCYNLKEIDLPDGLERIGYWAFTECNSLEEVKIPGSISHLSNYVFQNCKNLKKVVIMPGVETIGFDVFDGCVNLENITIPSSVQSIDVFTFRYCDNLTDVYYEGTEQEWNAIKIEREGNEALFRAEIHYEQVIAETE